MDWQARLTKRRENFSECPDGALTKPPKPGFVSFGSTPDGPFENIAPDSASIRARLLVLAGAEAIAPDLVHALTVADLEGCAGLGDDTLRAYLLALRDTDLRERGKCPPDETAPALCARCGPVWLAPEVAAVLPVVSGWPRALGCPWCHVKNRRAIPRPPVACGDCRHFTRDAVNPDTSLGRCTTDREPLQSEPMHYPHVKRQCEGHAPMQCDSTGGNTKEDAHGR